MLIGLSETVVGDSLYLGVGLVWCWSVVLFFFYFNDTATTEIYTLSLHDALPIWSPILSIADLNLKVETFQKLMQRIFHQNCPTKRFRVSNDTNPAWETPIIQKLRRAKDRAYRDGKPTFLYLRTTLNIFIEKAKRSYFNRKVNSLKAGTANWWRSIKTMESGTKAILPAHYLIYNALCDPQTFVNKLNDYYSSLATPKQEPADLDKQSIYHPDEISIGQVKKYLRQMDSRKSVHSGDFPTWMTKMCCEDVCTPITP